MSSCLVAIRDRLAELIQTYEPDCCALESVIYVQSHKTAITLGAARGSAIMAAAERGSAGFRVRAEADQAGHGRQRFGRQERRSRSWCVRFLGLTETPGAMPPTRSRLASLICAPRKARASVSRGQRADMSWAARRLIGWVECDFARLLLLDRRIWSGQKRAHPDAPDELVAARARTGLHDWPHAGSIEFAGRDASAASAFRNQPRRPGDLSRAGAVGRLFSHRSAPLRTGFTSLFALDRSAAH